MQDFLANFMKFVNISYLYKFREKFLEIKAVLDFKTKFSGNFARFFGKFYEIC